jgi:large subunit ribosomal protein L25
VVENEKIRIRIPIHFKGESIAIGVKTQGGIVSHQKTDLDVVCLPKDLPEFIEVDVSGLALNQSLHLSDLKVPEGVQLWELAHGRDSTVVSVHLPRAEEEPEPTAVAAIEGAEAVPAEGAAPAAGAPGAPGAAPAGDAAKKGAPGADAAKKGAAGAEPAKGAEARKDEGKKESPKKEGGKK